MTLEQLKQIKEEAAKKLSMRDVKKGYKITVGMGTAGIAAGAKAVLDKFLDEVQTLGIFDATVLQNGYLAGNGAEPVVVVRDTQGNETVYGNVSVEKVAQIVKEHVINGKVVSELVVENK